MDWIWVEERAFLANDEERFEGLHRNETKRKQSFQLVSLARAKGSFFATQKMEKLFLSPLEARKRVDRLFTFSLEALAPIGQFPENRRHQGVLNHVQTGRPEETAKQSRTSEGERRTERIQKMLEMPLGGRGETMEFVLDPDRLLLEYGRFFALQRDNCFHAMARLYQRYCELGKSVFECGIAWLT